MKIKVYNCVLKEQNELEVPIKVVRDGYDVFTMMQDVVGNATEEYAHLIMLNVKGEIIGMSEVSHGELSNTSMHPRDVFKRALAANAAGIIITHNHPSGDVEPSEDDIMTTRRMVEAGKILGCPVVDHVIVGGWQYKSLRAEGLLTT